jgi:serine/threonine-protein kinase
VTEDPLLRRLQALLSGQYTIERELGRGGMATVYLARDLRHDRAVAIKLLQPELTTATTAERFLREIQIIARLQHPHILTLIDSGAADGLVYYVMPHVEGESLRERLIWERQCNISHGVQVVRQVASALEYAHARGVVHRDIKPENILLSAGQAILADFGIARAIRDSSQQIITAVGMPLGTPAYMSPEQAAGRQDIDHRSDIYSLGCVLFEMLAGRPPFVAATVTRVMQMHLTDVPPAITTCRSAAPVELNAILAKALAKEPAQRFQTAKELAEALSVIEAVETLERATPTGSLRKITPPSLAGAAVQASPYGATPGPLKQLLVGAGALGAVVIIVLWATSGRQSGASVPPQIPLQADAGTLAYLASIGVKPLDPIGEDAEAKTLSAGLSEEITSQLSKIQRLRVISRTTMEAVADKGWTSREVADSLGIRYLLEGSVQRSGRDLAVTLQLIDAVNDAQVWSDSYRRPLRDILMIRQDIARRVVEALAARVDGLTPAGADQQSPNPEAVQAMAHGLQLKNHGDEESADQAISAFERALQLDPSSAAAATELSDALSYYVNLGFGSKRDPYRTLADAIRWGDRAVQLDPNLAMAWAVRGAARNSASVSPTAALADLERAVSLAPGSSRIRVFRGIALARVGRYDEALRELETATTLDPLNATTRGGGLALTALGGRRYAQAAREAHLAAARDPSFEGWRVIEGLAYLLSGDPRRCVDLKLTGLGEPVAAICLHQLGDTTQARALIAGLEARATTGPIGIYTMGFIGAYHARLGDTGKALEWLGKAHDLSPRAFDPRLLDSGLFDRVRSEPGFERGLEVIRSRVRGRFGS